MTTAVIPGWGLTEEEGLTVSFSLSLPFSRGQSLVNKILSVILVAVILGAIGAIGYVIVAPKVGEGFTEFYILGLEGKAGNYPEEVVVEKEGRVIVGITNREQATVSYRVKIRVGGVEKNEVGPIVLDDGQKWEEVVGFTLDRVGDNQKVEFLLYKDGESETYLKSLRLWIDVKERE